MRLESSRADHRGNRITGVVMFFAEKDRNELIALGEQAKRLRIKGADVQYADAMVKLDAKHIQLICRYPHHFQLIGAQR